MGTIRIHIEGLSPLLMHNPAGSMKQDTGGITRKTIPTPEDEAAASRYVLPDGNLYLPAIAARNCLLNGAKGYRIGKKSAMGILSAAVLMIDEVFPLLRDGKPIGGTEYSIDVRRAVVVKAGISRARARIELPWECECIFGFNKDLANVENIKQAMTDAGQQVGLLDYRVEKKGWFGRFAVTNVQEVE